MSRRVTGITIEADLVAVRAEDFDRLRPLRGVPAADRRAGMRRCLCWP